MTLASVLVVQPGFVRGLVDWDTASPSRREDDLAFSALTWVPLLTAQIAGQAGFGDAAGRHRRFHLLLDAYGYTGGRTAIRDAIIGRAERNVAMIRQFAAPAGTPPIKQAIHRSPSTPTRHESALWWVPGSLSGLWSSLLS